MAESPGRLLRLLASLLVRGPDAPFVIGDLEESMRRDQERGMSAPRARRRYVANTLASTVSLWRARLRFPSPYMPAIGASLLDLKLAMRMLVKHPGLTAVAVFALALGIPASLAPLHLLRTFDVTLPFEDGERIVGLRHWYPFELREFFGSHHEYAVWRESLSSFEHIGAAHSDRFNIVAEDGRARPWRGSRMSASSFTLLRVRPLLGRPLLESDEIIGASDVVVLGYDVWQWLVQGDTEVIGRTVRIGGTPHTVVGVMPEDFLFPDREHLWLPLRADALESRPGEGPELWIYGRLADGITEARALAEMTSIHRGLAEAHPQVYDELRPEIVPFTYLTTGHPRAMWLIVGSAQLFAFVLLAVACGNVGTLILARTAARSGEIAVRTALGASRARIVSQLFVETLVLAVLSTGLGLVLAGLVAERVMRVWDSDALPFWFDLGLDHRTVVPALAVAVFSAVIAGIVPALKATGRGLQITMQRMGAGRAGVRFGHATTALIVTEVALGVVCLFAGVVGYRIMRANEPAGMMIRPEQFLTAELRLPEHLMSAGDDSLQANAVRARLASLQQELVRRLSEEPGVRGVAVAGAMPGQQHSIGRVEVEGRMGSDDSPGDLVFRNWVGAGFFDGLDQRILHGRDLAPSDLPSRADGTSNVVIVNTSFVQRVLRGRNAIGQRVRYAVSPGDDPGPWYEIVGVVGNLGMIDLDGALDGAGMYHLVLPAAIRPMRLAIHLSGDPVAFGPRLHELAAAIDPEAMVADPRPMSTIGAANRQAMQWSLFALAVVAGIAVVLAVAGLYALMSFTVSQRRHEIGVRAALGADPASIISLIARRALVQLTIGILLAVGAISALLLRIAPDTALTPLAGWPFMLAGAAAAVGLVGMVACVVPTRHGLGIQPIEALKA